MDECLFYCMHDVLLCVSLLPHKRDASTSANEILLSAPQITIKVPLPNPRYEAFRDASSVSINAVSFAFGLKWEILNFGVLI